MTSKRNVYIAGIAAAFALSVGVGAMIVRWQGQGENYASPPPKPSASPTAASPTTAAALGGGQEAAAPKPSGPYPEILKQTGALNALDLSLGKLTIGDSGEKVQAVLGNPQSSRLNEYGNTVYEFDAMEVVLYQDGKVGALVSRSAAVSTPRGIHDGSSAQDVFVAYGEGYAQSAYENLALYEYTVQSKDGRAGILRFAVRNSDALVDYISIRTP